MNYCHGWVSKKSLTWAEYELGGNGFCISRKMGRGGGGERDKGVRGKWDFKNPKQTFGKK